MGGGWVILQHKAWAVELWTRSRAGALSGHKYWGVYGPTGVDSDWRWWKLHVCDDKQTVNKLCRCLQSTRLSFQLEFMSNSLGRWQKGNKMVSKPVSLSTQWHVTQNDESVYFSSNTNSNGENIICQCFNRNWDKIAGIAVIWWHAREGVLKQEEMRGQEDVHLCWDGAVMLSGDCYLWLWKCSRWQWHSECGWK